MTYTHPVMGWLVPYEWEEPFDLVIDNDLSTWDVVKLIQSPFAGSQY